MVFKWLKGNKDKPTSEQQPHAGQGDTLSGVAPQGDGVIENAVALAAGIEMVDAFYPGRDPIDYYGNGGFRFGDMSHQGALMFLPSGTRRWDLAEDRQLLLDNFAKVIEEKDDIEILLVGTGKLIQPLAPDVATALRSEGLKLDVMDTGAAVRTLNILLSEDRAVAAVLLPVE